MKNHKIQQWFMFVAILMLPLASMAQPGQGRGGRQFDNNEGGPRGNGQGQGRESFMDRIPDLTEKQKEDLKAIHIAAQQDILPLRNQINEKEAALMTLQTAKSADIKAINKAIDELSGLQAKVQKRKALAHQDVRVQLTDEQRLFLDTHFQKGKGKRGNKGCGHEGLRGK